MTPFWHPLSTLLLPEPRVFATPTLLRMMLAAESEVSLVYAGDAMWPAVGSGERFVAEPLRGVAPRSGDALVACRSGIPDLVRVDRVGPSVLHVVADSDPRAPEAVSLEDVLARARIPVRRSSSWKRSARRLALELREAVAANPYDVRDRDPAQTVQSKYEAQAPFYARREGAGIEPALLDRIRDSVPAASRILVAGSGAGKECFALAQEGWTVVGVDFAPSMVGVSRAEASRRGSSVAFVQADLRAHSEPPGSLGAVLFTYDVYSFLPKREDRIRILRGMRRWLSEDGIVFLSARRVKSAYARSILTAQHLARRGPGRDWGASHARWIGMSGELHRSFVQVFTDAGLRGEIEAAGFEPGAWEGGHVMLRSSGSTRPSDGWE